MNTYFLLGGLCVALMIGVWMRRKLDAEKQVVKLTEGKIALRERGKRTELPLSEVMEIKHSWIASFFYAAHWELLNSTGPVLKVNHDAVGIDAFLSELEKLLPGFSVKDVKIAVASGDVHGETITAWKSAA